ncbi:L,D-transpeptidase family protein [Vreelandella rituensis]|uniref:L,D-TPase catalytic domain-containing protein n=1 Tax=Vreelandella rituensis TaxID=2282306 RepID=A0A368U103_9GAMM|nr:L,D-transpeptidase family protein [Halomonas rituensis]RCV90780.1 hypothetical protein DU506_10980 [Halomonas rituensis]
MKTPYILTHWGYTSLAVMLVASLAQPVGAQTPSESSEDADTPTITQDAQKSAMEAVSPDELPRGHFKLPENGAVIGERYAITVKDPEETLIDIARRHNIGYEEIRMANPDVSLWVPGLGTEVVIPAQYILPPAPREGVVINLSELRLYYYPADNPDIVESYPVSVGRDEFATPVGLTKTTIKVKDPAWAPPSSMRREAAERGEPAPSIVPAGPDNPLGRHAILLDMPSYLIHGTNRPDGVGMRVSRGCIRMYPEDIESLYERLPSGTKVNLIDAPFKAGWSADGNLYGQSFPQLEENVGNFEPLIEALDMIAQLTEEAQVSVDYAKVRKAIENPGGDLVSLLVVQEPAKPAAPTFDEDSLFSQLELSALQQTTSEAETETETE